jgi:hypothetical protein
MQENKRSQSARAHRRLPHVRAAGRHEVEPGARLAQRVGGLAVGDAGGSGGLEQVRHGAGGAGARQGLGRDGGGGGGGRGDRGRHGGGGRRHRDGRRGRRQGLGVADVLVGRGHSRSDGAGGGGARRVLLPAAPEHGHLPQAGRGEALAAKVRRSLFF